MITIVLPTSVHTDKSPAAGAEVCKKSICLGLDFTFWPSVFFGFLPATGQERQQIWGGLGSKYELGCATNMARVEALMCWMKFSIHASSTFQSADGSSIAMELLPRDLQCWYRFSIVRMMMIVMIMMMKMMTMTMMMMMMMITGTGCDSDQGGVPAWQLPCIPFWSPPSPSFPRPRHCHRHHCCHHHAGHHRPPLLSFPHCHHHQHRHQNHLIPSHHHHHHYHHHHNHH